MNLIDHRPIMVVEDSDEDFAVTLWAFEKTSMAVPIVRCKDGEQAIDYLEKRGKYAPGNDTQTPAIILLDLNLPRTNGHQVLKHIKTSERLRRLPVVVVTSSARTEDVQACYQNGSNSYVVKPIGTAKLREMVGGLVEYWFRISLLPYLLESDGH
jgi:CheY-like chemotaxis protein